MGVGVIFSGKKCYEGYLRYEGVGGGPISRKKRYITLEWPYNTFYVIANID